MNQEPETRNSLLLRIADPQDGDAWSQFIEIYEPVVYRLARRKGLQDADARDLVQHVMSSVSRSIHRWRPDKTRAAFRTWLTRITHHAFIDYLRQRRTGVDGDSQFWLRVLTQLETDETQAEWELEHRREVFRWAARRIQSEFTATTWSAFTLTAIDGMAVNAVAQQLKMSIGSVYTARSRIIRRLKEEVERYE